MSFYPSDGLIKLMEKVNSDIPLTKEERKEFRERIKFETPKKGSSDLPILPFIGGLVCRGFFNDNDDNS